MKPFNELTPHQQFIRKNSVRLLIYGSFALVLVWSMSEMVRLQDNENASVQHVEDVMIDY